MRQGEVLIGHEHLLLADAAVSNQDGSEQGNSRLYLGGFFSDNLRLQSNATVSLGFFWYLTNDFLIIKSR